MFQIHFYLQGYIFNFYDYCTKEVLSKFSQKGLVVINLLIEGLCKLFYYLFSSTMHITSLQLIRQLCINFDAIDLNY